MIENCSRKCIQEVKKIKQQIIACAERLVKDMEDKISNAKNQLLVDIESNIKAVVEMSKQMKRLVISFETFGQDTEDVAFVLMMKEKRNIEEGIAMKDDLLKQRKPVTLEFQQSDQLVNLMSEITSMGGLEIKEKQLSNHETALKRQENQLSFLNIFTTPHMRVIDAGTTWVRGCVFMPEGELVISEDSNNCVKVFSPDFKLKNILTIGSRVWDVAVVSKNEVIVTIPKLNSLQFLTLSNQIEMGKCINVGMKCWRIDCKNKRLYVSLSETNVDREVVKVLTMDGVIVNTVNISHEYPNYLAVNSSGDRILVSTFTNGVLCIDNTGNTLYTYSDSQLNSSHGLLVDSHDNLMVCGAGNDNKHVVKSDGTKHRILIAKNDGLNSPNCLAYRPSDKTLIVGQIGKQGLLAFTMSYT